MTVQSPQGSKRVVIVTGGAQGIGRAFARRFSLDGYAVVIADVNLKKAQATVAELTAIGGVATAIRSDVSEEGDCVAMAEHAIAQFARIDVLINNAALKGLDGGRKKLWEIDLIDWDRLMAVNVRGVWLATRAVLPAMRMQGGGSIINMASTVILNGSTNFLHYAASKGAVLALTRSAARELGEFNIRVNCILSGYIPTESWQSPADPLKNMARNQARIIKREQVPEDLVGAAAFLASPDSSYLSGQSINIDGGQTHL